MILWHEESSWYDNDDDATINLLLLLAINEELALAMTICIFLPAIK